MPYSNIDEYTSEVTNHNTIALVYVFFSAVISSVNKCGITRLG